jgi:hypothetical protein
MGSIVVTTDHGSSIVSWSGVELSKEYVERLADFTLGSFDWLIQFQTERIPF